MRELNFDEPDMVSGGFRDNTYVVQSDLFFDKEQVVTATRDSMATFMANMAQDNIADLLSALAARFGVKGALIGGAAGHMIEQTVGDVTYSVLVNYNDHYRNYVMRGGDQVSLSPQ